MRASSCQLPHMLSPSPSATHAVALTIYHPLGHWQTRASLLCSAQIPSGLASRARAAHTPHTREAKRASSAAADSRADALNRLEDTRHAGLAGGARSTQAGGARSTQARVTRPRGSKVLQVHVRQVAAASRAVPPHKALAVCGSRACRCRCDDVMMPHAALAPPLQQRCVRVCLCVPEQGQFASAE